MSGRGRPPASKPDSHLGQRFGRQAGLNTELETLAELIFDATSLDEALFWHRKMVERIDLEVIALLISDDERDQAAIPVLRKLQSAYAVAAERLHTLIVRGEALNWSFGKLP
jgi:hypothetical protein